MKKITILLLSLIAIPALARTIHGTVTNEKGDPIPFATISVLDADSTLIDGAISDEHGRYSIETTNAHILQASYVGYTTRSASATSTSIDFTLREESQQMEEVQVKARRPLIERQMDKLVVNVAENPINNGSSLTNVLKRSPGVRVDKDGNITVNGKSVEVYIDGRPSYMSGEQLKGLLEGTDGSTIEKIEIITNPSAKYDASGQGGIINIKLKRNKMKGLNGTLVGSYAGMGWNIEQPDGTNRFKWLNQEFASLNLNYRTEKTYTHAELTQIYADVAQLMEIHKTTPDTAIRSVNNYLGSFRMYSLRLSNDWMPDSLNTFGFIIQSPIMRLGLSSIENSLRKFMPQVTANLNYTHVFDSNLERELTANIDYSRNSDRSHNLLDLTPGIVGNTVNLSTLQDVDIAAAKLDFQTRFWGNGMIECGVKYSYSGTINAMTTDSLLAGNIVPTAHQDFRYHENVAAMYITASKQWKKFNAKLGLRGEYTYSVGNWITSDTTSRYSYFNLFPTVFFGYNPSDDWSLSASYTRRIKRPSYSILNPFRTYLDAHSYQEGNPTLTPEFNNQVDLNFGWSHYISLSGNFAHTIDMLNQKTEILPNGDGRLYWTNFGTCTTHGFNVSFTEIPIVPNTVKSKTPCPGPAWLTFTLNVGYYNFINRSYDKTYFQQSHYWSANAALTSFLPKQWTLSLNGNYGAPMTIGYNHTSQSYGMDFGVRKLFPEKGVILNLNFQDILRSSSRTRTDLLGMAEGYSSYYINDMRQQKVSLTVVWMFGKQEWHKQRRVGDLEESSRLGGGTGIGN